MLLLNVNTKMPPRPCGRNVVDGRRSTRPSRHLLLLLSSSSTIGWHSLSTSSTSSWLPSIVGVAGAKKKKKQNMATASATSSTRTGTTPPRIEVPGAALQQSLIELDHYIFNSTVSLLQTVYRSAKSLVVGGTTTTTTRTASADQGAAVPTIMLEQQAYERDPSSRGGGHGGREAIPSDNSERTAESASSTTAVLESSDNNGRGAEEETTGDGRAISSAVEQVAENHDAEPSTLLQQEQEQHQKRTKVDEAQAAGTTQGGGACGGACEESTRAPQVHQDLQESLQPATGPGPPQSLVAFHPVGASTPYQQLGPNHSTSSLRLGSASDAGAGGGEGAGPLSRCSALVSTWIKTSSVEVLPNVSVFLRVQGILQEMEQKFPKSAQTFAETYCPAAPSGSATSAESTAFSWEDAPDSNLGKFSVLVAKFWCERNGEEETNAASCRTTNPFSKTAAGLDGSSFLSDLSAWLHKNSLANVDANAALRQKNLLELILRDPNNIGLHSVRVDQQEQQAATRSRIHHPAQREAGVHRPVTVSPSGVQDCRNLVEGWIANSWNMPLDESELRNMVGIMTRIDALGEAKQKEFVKELECRTNTPQSQTAAPPRWSKNTPDDNLWEFAEGVLQFWCSSTSTRGQADHDHSCAASTPSGRFDSVWLNKHGLGDLALESRLLEKFQQRKATQDWGYDNQLSAITTEQPHIASSFPNLLGFFGAGDTKLLFKCAGMLQADPNEDWSEFSFASTFVAQQLRAQKKALLDKVVGLIAEEVNSNPPASKSNPTTIVFKHAPSGQTFRGIVEELGQTVPEAIKKNPEQAQQWKMAMEERQRLRRGRGSTGLHDEAQKGRGETYSLTSPYPEVAGLMTLLKAVAKKVFDDEIKNKESRKSYDEHSGEVHTPAGVVDFEKDLWKPLMKGAIRDSHNPREAQQEQWERMRELKAECEREVEQWVRSTEAPPGEHLNAASNFLLTPTPNELKVLGSTDPYVAHMRADAGRLRCLASDSMDITAMKIQQLYFTIVWEGFSAEGNEGLWTDGMTHPDVFNFMDFRMEFPRMLTVCMEVVQKRQWFSQTTEPRASHVALQKDIGVEAAKKSSVESPNQLSANSLLESRSTSAGGTTGKNDNNDADGTLLDLGKFRRLADCHTVQMEWQRVKLFTHTKQRDDRLANNDAQRMGYLKQEQQRRQGPESQSTAAAATLSLLQSGEEGRRPTGRTDGEESSAAMSDSEDDAAGDEDREALMKRKRTDAEHHEAAKIHLRETEERSNRLGCAVVGHWFGGSYPNLYDPLISFFERVVSQTMPAADSRFAGFRDLLWLHLKQMIMRERLLRAPHYAQETMRVVTEMPEVFAVQQYLLWTAVQIKRAEFDKARVAAQLAFKDTDADLTRALKASTEAYGCSEFQVVSQCFKAWSLFPDIAVTHQAKFAPKVIAMFRRKESEYAIIQSKLRLPEKFAELKIALARFMSFQIVVYFDALRVHLDLPSNEFPDLLEPVLPAPEMQLQGASTAGAASTGHDVSGRSSGASSSVGGGLRIRQEPQQVLKWALGNALSTGKLEGDSTEEYKLWQRAPHTDEHVLKFHGRECRSDWCLEVVSAPHQYTSTVRLPYTGTVIWSDDGLTLESMHWVLGIKAAACRMPGLSKDRLVLSVEDQKFHSDSSLPKFASKFDLPFKNAKFIAPRTMGGLVDEGLNDYFAKGLLANVVQHAAFPGRLESDDVPGWRQSQSVNEQLFMYADSWWQNFLVKHEFQPGAALHWSASQAVPLRPGDDVFIRNNNPATTPVTEDPNEMCKARVVKIKEPAADGATAVVFELYESYLRTDLGRVYEMVKDQEKGLRVGFGAAIDPSQASYVQVEAIQEVENKSAHPNYDAAEETMFHRLELQLPKSKKPSSTSNPSEGEETRSRVVLTPWQRENVDQETRLRSPSCLVLVFGHRDEIAVGRCVDSETQAVFYEKPTKSSEFSKLTGRFWFCARRTRTSEGGYSFPEERCVYFRKGTDPPCAELFLSSKTTEHVDWLNIYGQKSYPTFQVDLEIFQTNDRTVGARYPYHGRVGMQVNWPEKEKPNEIEKAKGLQDINRAVEEASQQSGPLSLELRRAQLRIGTGGSLTTSYKMHRWLWEKFLSWEKFGGGRHQKKACRTGLEEKDKRYDPNANGPDPEAHGSPASDTTVKWKHWRKMLTVLRKADHEIITDFAQGAADFSHAMATYEQMFGLSGSAAESFGFGLQLRVISHKKTEAMRRITEALEKARKEKRHHAAGKEVLSGERVAPVSSRVAEAEARGKGLGTQLVTGGVRGTVLPDAWDAEGIERYFMMHEYFQKSVDFIIMGLQHEEMFFDLVHHKGFHFTKEHDMSGLLEDLGEGHEHLSPHATHLKHMLAPENGWLDRLPDLPVDIFGIFAAHYVPEELLFGFLATVANFHHFYAGMPSIFVNAAIVGIGSMVYHGLDYTQFWTAGWTFMTESVGNKLMGGVAARSINRGGAGAVAFVALTYFFKFTLGFGSIIGAATTAVIGAVVLAELLWVFVSVPPPSHFLAARRMERQKMRDRAYVFAALPVVRPRERLGLALTSAVENLHSLPLRQISRLQGHASGDTPDNELLANERWTNAPWLRGPIGTFAATESYGGWKHHAGNPLTWTSNPATNAGEFRGSESSRGASSLVVSRCVGTGFGNINPIEGAIKTCRSFASFVPDPPKGTRGEATQMGEGLTLPEEEEERKRKELSCPLPDYDLAHSENNKWQRRLVERSPSHSSAWPDFSYFPFYQELPDADGQYDPSKYQYNVSPETWQARFEESLASGLNRFGRVTYSIEKELNTLLYSAVADFPNEIRTTEVSSRAWGSNVKPHASRASDLGTPPGECSESGVQRKTGFVCEVGVQTSGFWQRGYCSEQVPADTPGAKVYVPVDLKHSEMGKFAQSLVRLYTWSGSSWEEAKAGRCVPAEFHQAEVTGSMTLASVFFRGPWRSHVVSGVNPIVAGDGDRANAFEVKGSAAVAPLPPEGSTRPVPLSDARPERHRTIDVTITCEQLLVFQNWYVNTHLAERYAAKSWDPVIVKQFLARGTSASSGWMEHIYFYKPPQLCACQHIWEPELEAVAALVEEKDPRRSSAAENGVGAPAQSRDVVAVPSANPVSFFQTRVAKKKKEKRIFEWLLFGLGVAGGLVLKGAGAGAAVAAASVAAVGLPGFVAFVAGAGAAGTVSAGAGAIGFVVGALLAGGVIVLTLSTLLAVSSILLRTFTDVARDECVASRTARRVAPQAAKSKKDGEVASAAATMFDLKPEQRRQELSQLLDSVPEIGKDLSRAVRGTRAKDPDEAKREHAQHDAVLVYSYLEEVLTLLGPVPLLPFGMRAAVEALFTRGTDGKSEFVASFDTSENKESAVLKYVEIGGDVECIYIGAGALEGPPKYMFTRGGAAERRTDVGVTMSYDELDCVYAKIAVELKESKYLANAFNIAKGAPIHLHDTTFRLPGFPQSIVQTTGKTRWPTCAEATGLRAFNLFQNIGNSLHVVTGMGVWASRVALLWEKPEKFLDYLRAEQKLPPQVRQDECTANRLANAFPYGDPDGTMCEELDQAQCSSPADGKSQVQPAAPNGSANQENGDAPPGGESQNADPQ
ncbi:unnamed protein product [Amoebophrya sp. A120]|nr:unnamed protein product [Amoebophrya sp. A120]|eukprot:GSA120T00016419001.1